MLLIKEKCKQRLKERDNLQGTRIRTPFSGQRGSSIEQSNTVYLNFCSNDYLGLSQHPDVIASVTNALHRYGLGSGGSQMVSGFRDIQAEVETKLATLLHKEKALVFSSGYLANFGAITALCDKNTTVFLDKLCHASLIDGVQASGAHWKRYRHGDWGQLRELSRVSNPERAGVIITESVFSMDGDLAPLTELSNIAEQQGYLLFVDEAHGLGVFGNTGAGALEVAGLLDAKHILVTGALGKSAGAAGGFVAGDAVVIDYLLQFCRTGTYSTVMPPAILSGISTALDLMHHVAQRKKLQGLIRYFREQATKAGLVLMPTLSPIQPLIIGRAGDALAVAAACERAGIWLTAIRPPTVPSNACRLRITLNATHSEAEIDYLISTLRANIPYE